MKLYNIKSDYSKLSENTEIKGDFADILWNGFIIHSKKKDHTAVERFGVDVPPIYTDGRQIILTDEIKNQLENTDLQGFEFKEVEKQKIIKGDWQNFSYDFFEQYDDPTYDPIEKGKHDEQTAQQMPKLWRIKPLHTADFKKVATDNFAFSVTEKADFYEAIGDRLGVFISEKTKAVFEKLSFPLIIQEDKSILI